MVHQICMKLEDRKKKVLQPQSLLKNHFARADNETKIILSKMRRILMSNRICVYFIFCWLRKSEMCATERN